MSRRVFLIIAAAAVVLAVLLWLFFTAFIGFNLLQSAFTGFCPLALILKAMGKKPGAAF